ncbi:hypothetical protein C8J56DRAFT_1051350 [Mycena floridula]|nr:hypothetical protein C8J56DRAFT_1051350 [Mycena floridula]
MDGWLGAVHITSWVHRLLPEQHTYICDMMIILLVATRNDVPGADYMLPGHGPLFLRLWLHLARLEMPDLLLAGTLTSSRRLSSPDLELIGVFLQIPDGAEVFLEEMRRDLNGTPDTEVDVDDTVYTALGIIYDIFPRDSGATAEANRVYHRFSSLGLITRLIDVMSSMTLPKRSPIPNAGDSRGHIYLQALLALSSTVSFIGPAPSIKPCDTA